MPQLSKKLFKTFNFLLIIIYIFYSPLLNSQENQQQKSSTDMGLNIFVINHAPMPHEIFDWKLEVSKTNNFSSILLDKF